MANIIRRWTGTAVKGSVDCGNRHSAIVPQSALGKLSAVGPIPQDILDLLWFDDGPLKNHDPVENRNSFDAGPVVITIGFGPSEPSAISISLPVATRPVDWDSVPDPPYYPGYDILTPDQRRKYLEWLTDVERDIQIGYVFVFYYGLERHLFFGRLDAAFDMVLRLRRSHTNGSFAYYSDSALIASAMFHNRPDLFMKYASEAPAIGAPEASGIYLLAKAALKLPLSPRELISVGRSVGFTNRRYINAEPELFEAILGDKLEAEFGQRGLDLTLFPVSEWPRDPQIIVANISFPQEQRTIQVPQLLESARFRERAAQLLAETHEAVKAQLKARPKGASGPLAKPLEQINQPVERPRLREGHSLFPPFDESQFDKNVEFYNQGVCPYCGRPLTRRPEQAMKCPCCGNRIRTRSNFLKGQKGFFREDEVASLNELADERARRNFICDVMEGNEIPAQEVRNAQARDRCPIEQVLLTAVAGRAAQYQRDRNMGLCRNSLLTSGEIYRRIGDKAKALTRFLQVAYYDVNGCANAGGLPGSAKFDLRFGDSVAPAILGWIIELADEQHLSRAQLREAFADAAKRIHEADMPRRPEAAWQMICQQLWPEED